MAGKPKKGIAFAGWNVDIFENDTKIDELIDAQGWIGFSVYFYLCQKAYASDGYFYRWSYANAATTARRMGGGIGSETVRQVVSACLRIGLFDKRLFDREGVLTSRGIQRRYMDAIQKRSCREVDQIYWLLPEEECKGWVLIRKNAHSLPEDAHSLPEDDTESKGKKRKEKESKGEERKRADAPRLYPIPTQEEVVRKNAEFGGRADPIRFFNYYEERGWMLGGLPLDWEAKLQEWNETEHPAKAANRIVTAAEQQLCAAAPAVDLARLQAMTQTIRGGGKTITPDILSKI